jgi:hypothetical protein
MKLQIIAKSAEHVEPVKLAFDQLESLLKWATSSAKWLLEEENMKTAVGGFHPDSRYDQNTRELVVFSHLSGVWLLWEKCDFDPANFKFWVRLALVKGFEGWADMSAVDHRKAALETTAQLAIYEGYSLQHVVQIDPPNVVEIWRRLYWFTRFFRAWQRIGEAFAPSQFADLKKKADTARAWKKVAWNYYKKRIAVRPELSVRTVATNFVKLEGVEVKQHEVQVYLSYRLKLFLLPEATAKETVRRTRSNTK